MRRWRRPRSTSGSATRPSARPSPSRSAWRRPDPTIGATGPDPNIGVACLVACAKPVRVLLLGQPRHDQQRWRMRLRPGGRLAWRLLSSCPSGTSKRSRRRRRSSRRARISKMRPPRRRIRKTEPPRPTAAKLQRLPRAAATSADGALAVVGAAARVPQPPRSPRLSPCRSASCPQLSRCWSSLPTAMGMTSQAFAASRRRTRTRSWRRGKGPGRSRTSYTFRGSWGEGCP
mmetsp:Transcript_9391/g.25426  ORF Transcript_9391/g.25426 Transcript_9391/m.25426 type:complete len:231 (-) Transcript_9391:91-783(-)